MTKALIIVAIAGLLIAGVAYNLQPRSAVRESASASAAGPVRVTVAQAVPESEGDPISLVGVLKNDSQAVVAATMPVRVLRVLVRNGETVRAGQPVVEVDSRVPDAQIQQSSAGVAAANAALQKAIDGKRARSIELDGQVDQARSGLSLARSKLTQAELGATLSDSSAESDSLRAKAAVKQAEAGLRQAEAGFKQAADTLKRLQFLYSKGGVSRAELQGAEVQAEIAKANKDSAESAMEQALAAEKPATNARPLRAKVSESEVQSARAGVRQAEDGLKSALLARSAAVRLADRDIEAARAQVRQASAGRTQAISASIGSALESPGAGMIADVSVHSGDVAQPGQPLMTVLGDGALYFEAAAPAKFAANLRPGVPATINLDSGESLLGTIRRVLSSSQDGRSIPVEIALNNRRRRLVAGASGHAEIKVAASRTIVVPSEAVRMDHGKQFVLVPASGVAERREIVGGGSRDGKTIVMLGLSRDESVIVSSPGDLKPGDRIEVAAP